VEIYARALALGNPIRESIYQTHNALRDNGKDTLSDEPLITVRNLWRAEPSPLSFLIDFIRAWKLPFDKGFRHCVYDPFGHHYLAHLFYVGFFALCKRVHEI